jgi:hypothetical protein
VNPRKNRRKKSPSKSPRNRRWKPSSPELQKADSLRAEARSE